MVVSSIEKSCYVRGVVAERATLDIRTVGTVEVVVREEKPSS